MPFCWGKLLNVYTKDPENTAKACVIWMHGLGADANDMAGLAEQLPLTVAVRHVFIDAPIRPVTLNNSMPMRAWYDISGVTLTDREDSEGILHSEKIIREVIQRQLTEGFISEQIFLAGFSQGGAMALFTGLHAQESLGGIIALSAYLPLVNSSDFKANKTIPIFMAYGQHDPLVLPEWTKQSMIYLQEKGYRCIEQRGYSMEHAICPLEVSDVAQWLSAKVVSIKQQDGGVMA